MKTHTFWQWFGKNSKKLFFFEKYEEEILPKTLDQLQKIHPDLVFEIGPEIDSQREFVVSANGMKEAFPAVIELVKDAPEFDEWIIVPFRQKKENADLEIQIDDLVLSPDNIYFNYVEENEKLHLNLYIEDIAEDDERLYHIAFILLDNLIGEYDVEMKIGNLDIHRLENKTNIEKMYQLKNIAQIIDKHFSKTVH